jgi:hypothetical protein
VNGRLATDVPRCVVEYRFCLGFHAEGCAVLRT